MGKLILQSHPRSDFAIYLLRTETPRENRRFIGGVQDAISKGAHPHDSRVPHPVHVEQPDYHHTEHEPSVA